MRRRAGVQRVCVPEKRKLQMSSPAAKEPFLAWCRAPRCKSYWQQKSHATVERLATISLTPYRLPYESDTLDVVVSTSVLEHAQNKEELFLEIHRVHAPSKCRTAYGARGT